MLRERDILLLLAAIFLVIASRSLNQRSFNQASASLITEASSIGQDRGNVRINADSNVNVDSLMLKIKQNIRNQRKQAPQVAQDKQTNQKQHHQGNFHLDPSKHNSYNHFANEISSSTNESNKTNCLSSYHHSTSNNREPNQGKHREAQEVKINFLRQPKGHRPVHEVNGNNLNGQNNQNNPDFRLRQGNIVGQQNTSLFMLNYNEDPLGQASDKVEALPDTDRATFKGDSFVDSIGVSEQQQRPQSQQPVNPFALFPQFNQQQQQQQSPINPLSLAQQNNIRQILNNYQRYGANNGPQQVELVEQALRQARQQQSQQQPNNVQNSRNSIGVPQQQQQPLSPLQILTAPLQAFLPQLNPIQAQTNAINGNSHNNNNNNNNNQQARQKQNDPAKQGNAMPQGGPTTTTTAQQGNLLNQMNGQPNALGGLLANGPFSMIQNGRAQQQPGTGMGNLQSLYQQLPLYQTLLAARQRQEALEAAEKLRQQQLQRNQQPPSHLANPLGLRPLTNPLQALTGGLQQPQLGVGQPQQPANQGGLGPLGQPAQFGQLLPINQFPGTIPNNNKPHDNQITGAIQGNSGQTVTPNNLNGVKPASDPNLGQVSFDDEANQGAKKPANINQPDLGPVNGGNENSVEDNSDSNNNNNGSGNSNNDNADSDQNNNNENGSNNNNNNAQSDGGNETGSNNDDTGSNNADTNSGGMGKAEEEDPDLKQFQNFANGGDSFTDLFPPGILSNNDINEIKKQQEEQAKRQEEEERQKQMQQQQGNSGQHDNNNHNTNNNNNNQAEQPQYERPIDQFTNQNQNQNNNNLQDQQQQNQQQPNSNQANEVDTGNEQQGNDKGSGDQAEDGDNNDGNSNENQNENENENEENPNEVGDQNEEGGGGENEAPEDEANPTAAALTSKLEKQKDEGVKSGSRYIKSPGVIYSSS